MAQSANLEAHCVGLSGEEIAQRTFHRIRGKPTDFPFEVGDFYQMLQDIYVTEGNTLTLEITTVNQATSDETVRNIWWLPCRTEVIPDVCLHLLSIAFNGAMSGGIAKLSIVPDLPSIEGFCKQYIHHMKIHTRADIGPSNTFDNRIRRFLEAECPENMRVGRHYAVAFLYAKRLVGDIYNILGLGGTNVFLRLGGELRWPSARFDMQAAACYIMIGGAEFQQDLLQRIYYHNIAAVGVFWTGLDTIAKLRLHRMIDTKSGSFDAEEIEFIQRINEDGRPHSFRYVTLRWSVQEACAHDRILEKGGYGASLG